jgi:hypothetical protein
VALVVLDALVMLAWLEVQPLKVKPDLEPDTKVTVVPCARSPEAVCPVGVPLGLLFMVNVNCVGAACVTVTVAVPNTNGCPVAVAVMVKAVFAGTPVVESKPYELMEALA